MLIVNMSSDVVSSKSEIVLFQLNLGYNRLQKLLALSREAPRRPEGRGWDERRGDEKLHPKTMLPSSE